MRAQAGLEGIHCRHELSHLKIEHHRQKSAVVTDEYESTIFTDDS